MKNKKFKSLLFSLVAVAMIFTAIVPAFAFTDTDDLTAAEQTAINKLLALEVFAGYPSGKFNPDGEITRAEFTKVAMSLAGMMDSAPLLENTATTFSDTKTGVWYTGWINLGTSKDVIVGFPDGTFKPNDVITSQEAITILLRVLGYSDNLSGTWPVNYITEAARIGLLDDIDFSGSEAISRVDIATIAVNLLGQNVVKWSNDSETFITQESTLFEESFAGAVLSDAEVDGIGVFFGGVELIDYDAEQFAILIDGEEYVLTDTTVYGGEFDLAEISGAQVDVIYEVKSDINTVKYIEVRSSVVMASEAIANGTSGIKLDGVSYDLVDGVEIPATQVDGVSAYIDNSGDVYAIVDNSAIESGAPFIVDSVNEDSGRISVLAGTAPASFRDLDVLVIKNGEVSDLGSISKYDVVYTLAGSGDADVIFYVESMVSGELERIYSGYLQINGINYNLATGAVYAEGSDDFSNALSGIGYDLVGETGSVLINKQNQIFAIAFGDVVESSVHYGVLFNYSMTNNTMSENYVDTLTIFNENGDLVTYDVEKGVFDSSDLSLGLVIGFELNSDGAIDDSVDVGLVSENDGIAEITDGTYISLNGVSYTINANTTVFGLSLDSNGGLVAELLDIDELMVNEELTGSAIDSPVIEAMRFKVNGLVVEMIVVANYDSEAVISTNYGVVKDAYMATSGIKNGIEFYGDDTIYSLADGVEVVIGNLYSFVLEDNEVTSATVVYDGSTVTPGDGNSRIEGEVVLKNGNLIQVERSSGVTVNIVLSSSTLIIDMSGTTPDFLETLTIGDTISVVLNSDGGVEVVVIK